MSSVDLPCRQSRLCFSALACARVVVRSGLTLKMFLVVGLAKLREARAVCHRRTSVSHLSSLQSSHRSSPKGGKAEVNVQCFRSSSHHGSTH